MTPSPGAADRTAGPRGSARADTGAARESEIPPSLLVLAPASVQCGAAILLRNRLDGLLRRRRSLWAAVVTVSLCAMTIFCRHQTALLTLAIPGSLLGDPISGLTTPPHTLARLPLVAAALIALGRLTHRFEAPWTGIRGPRRAAVAVLEGPFACYALRSSDPSRRSPTAGSPRSTARRGPTTG
ncbi:hypothetical protein P1P68_20220 [Streptomyces scabiei]|uniref:hypothetical protein n=1 Tax=Streptomyces scabiei TaxID=1930 RepID=UPI002990696F|nr:hypothetical protein [Streptomyces scabiei]MDW8807048.1 hypothetical protein [Streptomyces scabiei]